MSITLPNTVNHSQRYLPVQHDSALSTTPKSQNAPLAYSLVGQTIGVDTTPIAPLILAHERESFIKGLVHLKERQHLLRHFAQSDCLSVSDIESINCAIVEENAHLGHIVDQKLNKAMSHIDDTITDSVMRVLGTTTSFKRFEVNIKDNLFYGLSCDTEPCPYTDDTGLMVFSTDFFTHLYTGLASMDDTPLSRLYATFLDRLSSFAGVWQTDVASLYHEIWSGYTAESALLVERFTQHLSDTRSFDAARSALGEGETALSEFFDCIGEALWMATANEDLENINDDDLETILSEIDQHLAVAKVASNRHTLVQKESLTTMMKCVDRTDPKANALCELIEQVTPVCRIDEPVCRMRDCVELVGEGMEYLGVVLQEASADDVVLSQMSQQTYEHLMNAGEAEELLKVDMSNPRWKDALCELTIAVASLSAAAFTMTEW